jgi:hypothetical protein
VYTLDFTLDGNKAFVSAHDAKLYECDYAAGAISGCAQVKNVLNIIKTSYIQKTKTGLSSAKPRRSPTYAYHRTYHRSQMCSMVTSF